MIRYLVIALTLGCSRPQVAPDDKTLPQPDRGACPKSPAPMLYLRLPRNVDIPTGAAMYCDPLDVELRAAGAGSVSGAGVLIDESDDSLGCGIRTSDADRAIAIAKKKLRELGAPKRTVIEELCEGVGSVHTVW